MRTLDHRIILVQYEKQDNSVLDNAGIIFLILPFSKTAYLDVTDLHLP